MDGRIRIQLFDEFRVHQQRRVESPSLLSAQKVIALLCSLPDHNWPRAEIGRHIWPDSDEESNRNRIRTALVQVRSIFGDTEVIEGDKSSVLLNSHLISCDLWDAKSAQRKANGAADEPDEEQALNQLLEIIQMPYLPGFPDSWAESERRRWNDRAFTARMRLGAIAESRKDWDAAIDQYELALNNTPYDERVWAANLRAHAQIGRHIQIFERFNSTKVRLRKDIGGRFTPSLINLAESLSTGRLVQPDILASQGDMASRTFTRMLDENPEDALKFLSSESFRVEVFLAPLSAVDLLARVLEKTTGTSEERLQCVAYAVLAYTLLNRKSEMLRWASFTLKHDPNLIRQRGASNAMASSYFQGRDWEKAFHYGNQTLEIATRIGNNVGIHLAHAQLAAFELHHGKFDKALAMYKNCLQELAKSKQSQALQGRAVITINAAGILAFKKDYEQAKVWFERGINLAEVSNNPTIINVALPSLGVANIMLENTQLGKEQLARGASLAYRSRDARTFEIVLDLVAIGFAKLGYSDESLAVLQIADHYRADSLHPRSTADGVTSDRVKELCGTASANREWLALPTRRHVIAAILDKLNSG